MAALDQTKDAIVDTCKELYPRRSAFLETMLMKGFVKPDIIFWCTSTTVEARLADAGTEKDLLKLGFHNWKAHGEVYLAFLARLLLAAQNDPLRKGKILRDFQELVHEQLNPEQIDHLFRLIDENVLQPSSSFAP